VSFVPSSDEISSVGGDDMYGVFGGYTRWAVVFLIIFVLFFLFVPAYGYGAAYPGVAVAHYGTGYYPGYHVGYHGYSMMGGYESPSS
jgi:hypothetical protein